MCSAGWGSLHGSEVRAFVGVELTCAIAGVITQNAMRAGDCARQAFVRWSRASECVGLGWLVLALVARVGRRSRRRGLGRRLRSAKRAGEAVEERRDRHVIVFRMGMAGAIAGSVGELARADDWMRAHTALTRLARERGAADAEEGRWLLLAWRSGAHVFLGFGSFAEYVERLLGDRSGA